MLVDPAHAGDRLDYWLSRQPEGLSRARWQDLIKEGRVLVNGTPKKPNYSVRPNDDITWTLPPPAPVALVPEDRPLDILFEDRDLIVLNKPPGLVIHPAPGHTSGTLVHALLHHCTDLVGIGGELRPGIVHRLDQDTSGVLVVAKNEIALNHLAAQFKQRETRKEYVALVWGRPKKDEGTIHTLIGRDPHHRQKMCARPLGARPGSRDSAIAPREALSHYALIEVYPDACFLRIRIETGRTHQIRVHLTHIGCPIVGDALYGRTRRKLDIPRQMLHAERIRFTHPSSGQTLEFTAPIPSDFLQTQALLRSRE